MANGLPCVLSTGVPQDVYLTDLLRPISLEHPEKWIDAICSAERGAAHRYTAELKARGMDTDSIMRKYAEIYERVERL